MFEEELDEPAKLIRHLDSRAPGGWGAHTPTHASVLHEVATACLEPRRRSRAELADVLPKLEDIRGATLALGPNVPARYFCPLTQEIMEDPVNTADGHTYERAAIAPVAGWTRHQPGEWCAPLAHEAHTGDRAAAADPGLSGSQPRRVKLFNVKEKQPRTSASVSVCHVDIGL